MHISCLCPARGNATFGPVYMIMHMEILHMECSYFASYLSCVHAAKLKTVTAFDCMGYLSLFT